MNEILKLMNELRADELDSLIMRANIILEKKRKEEAEAALREKERQRQERIAQEKKRQQEIAELLRKLQELQNQKIVIPDEPVQGNDFVMYDVRRPIDDARVASAAVKPASTQATPAQSRSAAAAPAPKQSSCPHCHALNPSGSAFCANCGQRMDGKPLAQPAPKAQPVQRSGECVRYFTESEKEWQLFPGEKNTSVFRQDIQLVQPEPTPKMAYTMRVTNKRIIIEYIGSFAKNVGLVGGIAGELIRDAGGKGYKPWVEIPMAAITRYGVNAQNQFVIEAGETFVFKNKGYVKNLTDVIAKAKAGGM